MKTTKENLADRVLNLRKARRFSQEKLAEISGVPRRTLQNIESGQTLSPGLDTVTALAQALGVSVGDLSGAPGSPAPDLTFAATLLSKFVALSPVRQRFVLAVVFGDESYLSGDSLLAQAYRTLSKAPGKV